MAERNAAKTKDNSKLKAKIRKFNNKYDFQKVFATGLVKHLDNFSNKSFLQNIL